MPEDFKTFFSTATGKPEPYDYQSRLADLPCESRLISVPTGLGKTAAVILAWLWNRQGKVASALAETSPWPRRLVYCLPMRTLVEQTYGEAENWLKAHGLLWDGKPETRKGKVGLHILMGGEETEPWDLYPEEDAILIGTQDMLLSRALNRGYGMSRYRWPMHFGLLNNDCLWVMDETQLMGVGVETSAQLDGFRHLTQWLNHGPCQTWWMSATLDDARLSTVDHPLPTEGWSKIELTAAERLANGVRERFEAKKPAHKSRFILSSVTKDAHAKELAQLIKEKHQPNTLTLVVVNRVNRARKLYATLRDKKLGLNSERIALIHSRFRPVDRERHTKLLFEEGDRIVIATQAVEAGVDVSARLLVTELAPWSSLVQRIGRSNRKGDISNAEFLWVDIQPKDEKDDLVLPYTLEELNKARSAIQSLEDVGPQSLAPVKVEEPRVIRPVIRRRDLLDLFDTTPDLCGQDLDISRYIRDGEDSDVQFFWRDIKTPSDKEAPPERLELCRVSIGDAKKFLDKKSTRAWQWDDLHEVWQEAKNVRPGNTYLVASECGGYDDELGWTGDPKSKVTVHPPHKGEAEGYTKDPLTCHGYWLEYAKHVEGVVGDTRELSQALALNPETCAMLQTAALWHDAGKSHEAFQKMLCGEDQELLATLWAKSANKNGKCWRFGFRHELASALMWLIAGPADASERDLIAYIIAAHHGKVRLSIRALPEEKGEVGSPERLFARGIWDGDELPIIPDLTTQPVKLDLSLMQMGTGPQGPSWLARMIVLRDRFGPFSLAFLETLLRAADMRTSAEEAKSVSCL
jgi:CRISPR-associated endonuclease/helicase Cas3